LKAGTGPIVSTPGVSVGVIGEGGGGDGLVSYQEFSSAVTGFGYPNPSQEQYNVFVNSAGPKGLITSKQEAAMALVHFLHESDGLRAKREYRCADNGCPGDYETPGCDVNGQDYYGRGYIQLTWCFNYAPASQELYGNDILVRDPDMVARDENAAWDTAFWFWKTNVHFAPGVQEGRFGASTRAINGNLECDGAYQETARHRYDMYKSIRRAFGLQGDGDESGCYN
jgi:predicted chitinase